LPGAILFVIVMVLVVPVAIMFGGAVWSALSGWYMTRFEQERAESATDATA
jgi:hypothetical protein